MIIIYCNEYIWYQRMSDFADAAFDSGMYTDKQIDEAIEKARYFKVFVKNDNMITWGDEYFKNYDPSHYMSKALPDDILMFETYHGSKFMSGGLIKGGTVEQIVHDKSEFKAMCKNIQNEIEFEK